MGGALKARSPSIFFRIVVIGSLFGYSIAAARVVGNYVDNHFGGDHWDGNEKYKSNTTWLSFNNKTVSEWWEWWGEQVQQEKDTSIYLLSLLGLGVETVGGVMTEVIPARYDIPIRRSKVFTTTKDQQTTVTIQVFKGKRSLTRNCLFLGEFNLTGIAPAPRGTPHIEVIFEIDSIGTLTVKAKDKVSGLSEKMAIPIDDYDVWHEHEDEMVREAEEEKKVEEDRIVGPHILKTYVYNHIRNHMNDKDNKQAGKLALKKVKPSTDDDDDDDDVLTLFATSYSRWRFKIKTSKSDNQIAER